MVTVGNGDAGVAVYFERNTQRCVSYLTNTLTLRWRAELELTGS